MYKYVVCKSYPVLRNYSKEQRMETADLKFFIYLRLNFILEGERVGVGGQGGGRDNCKLIPH